MTSIEHRQHVFEGEVRNDGIRPIVTAKYQTSRAKAVEIYPAADKVLKVLETRASENLCSAEALASKYLRARKPHSESGEFRCRQAVRGPILQGRENSPIRRNTAYHF